LIRIVYGNFSPLCKLAFIMANLQVVVVTPECTTLDQPAESVSVPLMDGEAGILAGHAPMIGRLAPGELRVAGAGKSGSFYVDGGFVQVAENVVSILTGRCVPVNQIDRTAAQQLLDKTQISASDKAELVEIKNRTIAQARAQLRLATGGR
jgi:F-type H+-transporting ATPase subunit epsilon